MIRQVIDGVVKRSQANVREGKMMPLKMIDITMQKQVEDHS